MYAIGQPLVQGFSYSPPVWAHILDPNTYQLFATYIGTRIDLKASNSRALIKRTATKRTPNLAIQENSWKAASESVLRTHAQAPHAVRARDVSLARVACFWPETQTEA